MNSPIIVFLSTMFGAAISYWTQVNVEERKRREKKKALTAAIYGEIKSLLTLFENRDYLKFLKEELSCVVNPEKRYSPLNSFIPVQYADNFFLAYKSNVSDIGILDSGIVSLVVQFYQAVFSLLEDVTSNPRRAYVDAVNLSRKNFNGTVDDEDVQGNYERLLEKFLSEDIKILEYAIRTGKAICNQLEEKYRF